MIQTYAHRADCRAHEYADDTMCDCTPFRVHRAAGHVGTFTVHAPADYLPRHRSEVCGVSA